MEKSQIKLTAILEEVQAQQVKKLTVQEKKDALASIAEFGLIGAKLNREHGLVEIASALQDIAVKADRLLIDETGDTFDSVTVSRNSKELKKYSDEFQKLARESAVVEQRMQALFDDCGRILGRYFDINDISQKK